MKNIERQLSHMIWFNRCLIACIVLFFAAWFIGKAFGPETVWAKSGEKEIRANKFVLEDENGNPRAGLSVSEDMSALSVYDEKGKARSGWG